MLRSHGKERHVPLSIVDLYRSLNAQEDGDKSGSLGLKATQKFERFAQRKAGN